ncbi:neuropeptides capa receptor-like [Saccostrea echinata]|uniref:neuropeptides capa receptor-like n=1 Tax=Saccostrea echinata TaxID=191078 RepID=UPI002A7FA935|nr:neuropeptides capa receptor-like [Saccostrea echinata]
MSNNSYWNVTEYKIQEALWTFLSPFLIVVGDVGSLLSVVVLNQHKLSRFRSSTFTYLKYLALGDILLLNGCLFPDWINYAFNVNIRKYSIGCKIHSFLVYLSTDFTNWILVAVSIDRCIAVCLPLKARTYDHFQICKATISALFVVMTALNVHLFWNMETSDQEEPCVEANHFTSHVWPWIDFCVFCVLPFLIMFSCNVLLLRAITKSRKKAFSYRDSKTSITNDIRKEGVTARRSSHLTKMLLTVSSVFLVLTFPIITVELPRSLFFNADSQGKQFARYKLAWTIGNMLQYVNSAGHFFMYFLTCPSFRDELKCLVCKCKRNSTMPRGKVSTVSLSPLS